MRRKDREVTEMNRMMEIMEECDCCRIGLQDGNGVYIVPLNFGYTEEQGTVTLYFHCAAEGKKLELIRENPCVGFEMDTRHELVTAKEASSYTFRFCSLIGRGTASFVDTLPEKAKALQTIMRHYSGRDDWALSEKLLERTTVLRLEISEMTGKENL